MTDEPFDPRPYSTFRKIRDRGDSLTVYCSRCGHSAPVPIEAIAERIGWDTDRYGVPWITWLRCGRCNLKVGPSGRNRDGDRLQVIFGTAETQSVYRYPKF